MLYLSARPDDLEAARHLLNLSALANRTLANFGVVAISAAILLWSIALIRGTPRHAWLGLLGVTASAAPVALISLDILRLDVSGMTTVVPVQTAWYLAIGFALALGKIWTDPSRRLSTGPPAWPRRLRSAGRVLAAPLPDELLVIGRFRPRADAGALPHSRRSRQLSLVQVLNGSSRLHSASRAASSHVGNAAGPR